MQIVNITSLSGTAPYDIYVCDTTLTYCFLVATGIYTAPLSVDLPSFLNGTKDIIVQVSDSTGCQFFTPISCLLPTPSITVTPSFTPTPTPTQTAFGNNCRCIQFDNSGSGEDIGYQYTNCNGVVITDMAIDGQIICRCGSNPLANNIKLSVTILGSCNSTCSSGVCPPGT